ncbi:hypothetical protein KUV95_15880 [Microbulbifer agarilyticus]|uniref:hypothetical protein n=1 Tax=Microbulbifer agarilyticus TaxID=260552 RepID=UPI001C961915|nr:hypothetical protein [Microbulbifer agarilyticus]MBY6213032.1 hypothetical protein [Microbulbifer agarilyticus]
MTIKRIHLVSGMVFLAIFAITGQYMLRGLALPDQAMDAQRMMYRASHMYILFAAALNAVVGCYWSARADRLNYVVQVAGSWMLILSQPVLLYAFATEPQVLSPGREFTLLGCVLVLTGVLLSIGASVRIRRASVDTVSESTG